MMTSNEKLCENLRHGIYFDGYDILSDKTNGIMKEGAARIKRQALEIESLTAENERNRQGFEFHALLADKRYWEIEPLTAKKLGGRACDRTRKPKLERYGRIIREGLAPLSSRLQKPRRQPDDQDHEESDGEGTIPS